MYKSQQESSGRLDTHGESTERETDFNMELSGETETWKTKEYMVKNAMMVIEAEWLA